MPSIGERVSVDEGLEIRGLAPGVWLHTTWRTLSSGTRFPSNGLIVEAGDGIYLVDSAWGERETRGLVAWVERAMGRPITVMLSTHHHDDRASGVAFLKSRGARTLGHPVTRGLAESDGLEGPDPLEGLDAPGSAVRLGPLEVFYPGPAHAHDNVLVWLDGPGLLFGGCAVRPGGSSSLGNIEDADVEGWGPAMARVRDRYGTRALTVVPGHGPPGDAHLLHHTIELLK